MEMVQQCMPRFRSASSIFFAVVVFPEPEGPESRTIGLLLLFSAIRHAAPSICSAYRASHSIRKPFASHLIRSLI
jgi:hypothetical protein